MLDFVIGMSVRGCPLTEPLKESIKKLRHIFQYFAQIIQKIGQIC